MLALLTSSTAFSPAMAPAGRAIAVQMSAGPMFDSPYAPEGMGREFINSPRKPLSEYVGASIEIPGGGGKAWDPMSFTELWKVSANNPDVAWLREAELKHGRMSMLAFAGILATNAGIHLPGEAFADSDWTSAWGSAFAKEPAGMLQVVAFIGLHEGASSQGLFDLWLGNTDKREPGDLGFDPLKLMPNTKEAADLMRLKELKNGRMAMIAVAGFAANHFIPGSVPGLQGVLP